MRTMMVFLVALVIGMVFGAVAAVELMVAPLWERLEMLSARQEGMEDKIDDVYVTVERHLRDGKRIALNATLSQCDAELNPEDVFL